MRSVEVRQKIFRPHLSTATDARAVRTREALRQALLELLRARPFEQITIRDIAALAGTGYTTFFRHHPTKEALLEDIAAAQIGRLIDLVMPVMDAQSARAASQALFSYVDEHRALWSILLTGGAASALREEFLRISGELADSRAAPGVWPPAEVAIALVVSGTIELLAWWLRQAKPISVAEISEIHHEVVVHPSIAGIRRRTRRAAAGTASTQVESG